MTSMKIDMKPEDVERVLRETVTAHIASALSDKMPGVLGRLVSEVLNEKVGKGYGPDRNDTRLVKAFRTHLTTIIDEEVAAWNEKHSDELRTAVREKLAKRDINKLADSLSETAVKALASKAYVNVQFIKEDD